MRATRTAESVAVTAVAETCVGAASSGGRKRAPVMVRRLVAVLSMAIGAIVPSATSATAGMLGTHLHAGENQQGCDGGAGDPRYMFNDGIGSALLNSSRGTLAVNLTLKNVTPSSTFSVTVNQCTSTGIAVNSSSVTSTSRGTGSAKFSVPRQAGAPIYLTLVNNANGDDSLWSDTRKPSD